VLTGDTGDNRIFNFTTGTRTLATSTVIDVPLASSQFPVAIARPFLGLSVFVNNSSSTPSVVTPGEHVTVMVTYQNNLSTAITDAVIVAKLSGFEIELQIHFAKDIPAEYSVDAIGDAFAVQVGIGSPVRQEKNVKAF